MAVWLEKLKTRWGLTSYKQVMLILLVFACTGTSVLYLKKLVLPLLGIDDHTTWWLRLLASIFVILPLYQVVLLLFGFLFGQFHFFWNFEKRTFGRIANLFTKKIQ
jgi:hypothetical protein